MVKETTMKIALDVINTHYTANPAIVARKAEELGFESLWFGEHPFIPVNYATQYPSTPDGRIPPFYHQMLDPFVCLAAAAAVTQKINLSTGICLVPERNIFFLAKEVATLDYVCGGRLMLGVGAGWLKEETDILGIDFSQRHRRMVEGIRALREIWTKDEAEFHGKFIDFPPILCEPKTVRRSGVPIHLGAHDENGLKRVVAWADGWCPVGGQPSEQMGQSIKRLRELAEDAGRDPDSIEISMFSVVEETDPVADIIEKWGEMGVHRVVLSPVSDVKLAYTGYRFDMFAAERVAETLEWLAGESVAKMA